MPRSRSARASRRTCRCTAADLAWVGAFFVAPEARGLGIGRRLMDAVIDDSRADHRYPCLEVLPVHPAAMSLYRAMGWRVMGSVRPDWLRATAGEQGPDIAVMILANPR